MLTDQAKYVYHSYKRVYDTNKSETKSRQNSQQLGSDKNICTSTIENIRQATNRRYGTNGKITVKESGLGHEVSDVFQPIIYVTFPIFTKFVHNHRPTQFHISLRISRVALRHKNWAIQVIIHCLSVHRRHYRLQLHHSSSTTVAVAMVATNCHLHCRRTTIWWKVRPFTRTNCKWPTATQIPAWYHCITWTIRHHSGRSNRNHFEVNYPSVQSIKIVRSNWYNRVSPVHRHRFYCMRTSTRILFQTRLHCIWMCVRPLPAWNYGQKLFQNARQGMQQSSPSTTQQIIRSQNDQTSQMQEQGMSLPPGWTVDYTVRRRKMRIRSI